MPRSTTALLLWRKRRRRHRWAVHGRNCSEFLPSKFGNSLLQASLQQIFFFALIFFCASHFILISLVISVSLMFCWASGMANSPPYCSSHVRNSVWQWRYGVDLSWHCRFYERQLVEVWYWPFPALLGADEVSGGSFGSWSLPYILLLKVVNTFCSNLCVCQGFLWFLMVLSILFFMFVDTLDLQSPESLSGYVLILFQVVLNCKNGKLSQWLWRSVSKSVCWVLNCGCHYANCCLTCQHFPMDPVI